MTQILCGEIDLVSVTVPAAIPFINSGKLRWLAVLSGARLPQLPNVPSSKKAGHPDLLLESWYGVMAPAGVRPDIVERLNTELRRIMHQPDTVKQLARVGIDAVTSSPTEYGAFVKADTERWAKVIREANIRLD